MQKKVRAFIAVDIPEEIRESISAFANESMPEGVGPVGVDQMHITLFFLGNVNEQQIERVKMAMQETECENFDISLTGVATFIDDRPNVLFVKIVDGAERLNDYYVRLRRRLEGIGVRLEARAFTPHLTIARVQRMSVDALARIRKLIDENGSREFGRFTCDSIRLKSSVLKSEGAEHTDIFVRSCSNAA